MTKTLTIGPALPGPHEANTYEVEITVMHGDADGYNTFTVGPFYPGEEEALSSLLETLERMKAKFPNGRGGDADTYNFSDVEGFESWFGSSYGRTEEEYKENYRSTVPYPEFAKHYALNGERDGTQDGWPSDVTSYDGLDADFYRYTVVFYDYSLVAYSVEVSA